MSLPLANVTAPDPMMMLILGIIALVPIVNGVLNIIGFFRKNPPAGDYALKKQVDEDLARLEARVNERIAGELGHIRAAQTQMRRDFQSTLAKMEGDIDDLTKTITKAFSDFNRTLGQLEGNPKR